jgi:membrane protease YdiL (CAAX protease family)
MGQSEDLFAERKLDQVPWTFQQTIIGTVFTLVPWLFFVFGLTGTSNNATHIQPLTPQKDLLIALLTCILSSLIEAAFLVAPLYYANRAARATSLQRGTMRQALGFLGFRAFNVGQALSWLCLLIVAIIAVDNLYQIVITGLHLHLQTNDQVLLRRSASEPLTTYATLAVAVIVAPFCEEIFFRGFVFKGLQRGLPLGWAILVSALLFAIAHADLASAPVLFIIGLALAFLRWRTRSIWPGIILHMLNNGIGALTIILVMHGLLKA